MPKHLRGLSLSPCRSLAVPAAVIGLLLSLATLSAAPAVALRYLGHSCFLVTTPSGARLLIDPYSSGEWPALVLPSTTAERVLVTHPHWDHDASRDVRGKAAVIAEPGEVRGEDFVILGFPGRHARVAGEGIGYRNTVYVIETGGLRLCHLGDNGPGEPALVTAITEGGPIDVLMVPVDSEKRVLTYEEVQAWIDALSPRVVLPMHYLLPGLAHDSVAGLGTLDEWLRRNEAAVLVDGDSMTLDQTSLPGPGRREVRVFRLPGQDPFEAGWPTVDEVKAAEARERAQVAAAEGDLVTAMSELMRAAALNPRDPSVMQQIGFLHLGEGRPARALEFFGMAIAATEEEREAAISLAWLGSGMAHDLLGERDRAESAYRKVIEIGLNDELQLEQARHYLETAYSGD